MATFVTYVTCLALVLIGLFVAGFWLRAGSRGQRALSQATIALFVVGVTLAIFAYYLLNHVPVVSDYLRMDDIGFEFSATVLLTGVMFLGLGVGALISPLRQRRWGIVALMFLFTALPFIGCAAFAYSLMLVHADQAILWGLLANIPVAMLPLFVYSIFFAPGSAGHGLRLMPQANL